MTDVTAATVMTNATAFRNLFMIVLRMISYGCYDSMSSTTSATAATTTAVTTATEITALNTVTAFQKLFMVVLQVCYSTHMCTSINQSIYD